MINVIYQKSDLDIFTSVLENMLKYRKFCRFLSKNVQTVVYTQGQEPEPKVREYFYYIDHQGMVLPIKKSKPT